MCLKKLIKEYKSISDENRAHLYKCKNCKCKMLKLFIKKRYQKLSKRTISDYQIECQICGARGPVGSSELVSVGLFNKIMGS